MAKKKNNGYFNIFSVGDILVKPEEATEETPVEKEQFFSIANIMEESVDDIDDVDAAQITMFNGENSEISENNEVFNAKAILEDDTFIDEEIDEIDESAITEEYLEEELAQEFFVEEVVTKETEETVEKINEKAVDEVVEEKTEEEIRQLQEEETLVSMLETNMLEEEVQEEVQEEIQEEKQEDTEDIFKDIPDYKTIKRTKKFDTFETPYVYHGKNGDRIRYRLYLPTDNQAKRLNTSKSILSWLLTISLALILAIVIRSFVFLVATVDGPSMQPTLTSQDRLLVTRFTYAISDVQRGDIVICKYDTPIYPDMYVKRVIGLPGETISIVDGVVYINGAQLKENYTLPSTQGNRFHNMDPYYIPEGHVFVMGDNRNNSADSRFEIIGAISLDNVIGKAQARIFPFTNMGTLEEDN